MSDAAPRRPEPAASLLGGVFSERLDPGYLAAAERRGGGRARGRAQRAWLVAGTLAMGLLLGVAARHAAAMAPAADQTARSLVAEVAQARERTEDLGHRATAVTGEVDLARARALAGDDAGQQLLSDLARLQLAVGAVPVRGPGLRITVTDPSAPAGAPTTREQTVLDRDLQVLLNALWSAGAEAIAVGGVRLHPMAAVRQAGGAMLVDNRPVSQPYLIEAIGDPERLQTNLIETDGYGRFRMFAELYRTEFRIETAAELSLPAGVATPRWAVPAAAALPGEGNR